MTNAETVKKLITNIRLHFFFILIAGLLLNNIIKFDTQAAFVAGLVLGAILSVARLLLLEQAINKSLSMQSAYAGVYAVLQISLRNFLTTGLLACTLFISFISIWGVLAGMLLLKSSAFSLRGEGA